MSKKKEKRINELREGYKNTQELIRFIDAKVGIVIGFCGMVFLHCMDEYYSTFPYIPESSIFSFYVLKLFLVLCFIIATIIAFLWSFGCIIARGPTKQSGHPRILFPIGNYADFSIFKRAFKKCDNNHEYDELLVQIFNVGLILDIKIRKSKIAVKALIAQIIIWSAIMLSFWVDKNF